MTDLQNFADALKSKDKGFKLESHLTDNSSDYKNFRKTHEIEPRPAGSPHIDPQYQYNGDVKLKLGHTAESEAAFDAIKAEAEAKSKNLAGYKAADGLEEHGKLAHSHLDRTERTVQAAREDLAKQTEKLNKDVVEAVRKGHLKAEEGQNAQKLIGEQAKEIENQFKSVEDAIKAERGKVTEVTGVKSLAKEFKDASKTVTSVAKEAGEKRAYFKNIVPDIKANAAHGGFSGKAKVGVGAIGVIDGARRMVKGIAGSSDPEKQDSRMGNLVVGLGEIAGGVALAKMGGKNQLAR